MGNYNRLLQDFALRCGLPEIQHNSYSRGQELWKKKKHHCLGPKANTQGRIGLAHLRYPKISTHP